MDLATILAYLAKFTALVKTPDACLLISLVMLGSILKLNHKFTDANIPFVVLAFGAEGGALFFAGDHATTRELLKCAWQGFCYGGLAIGIYEVGLKYGIRAIQAKFPFLKQTEPTPSPTVKPDETPKPTA